jgi:integrase
MVELGQVRNLVRRGAVYQCRMRCPQHLLRDGMPPEKSLSLGTKERSTALELLPAARRELMEFFQGITVPATAPSLGIARSVNRARRPDHPDLPLLLVHEVEPLTRQFFAIAWAELDLASADNVQVPVDQRGLLLIELEHRLADLGHGAANAEDPVIAVEIALLRKAARRSPISSDASRLFRGYIRRALTQLGQIEIARLQGDYRDQITDSLFKSQAGLPAVGPTPLASAVPKVLFCTVRKTFERSELDGDDSISEKTRVKKRAALLLVERFFGTDCDVLNITGADCRMFRDLLGRLPPNLTKRFPENLTLAELADANSEINGPRLSYETQGLYLRLLNNLLAFAKSDGLITDNPFPPELGPRGKKVAREKARNAYSDNQLRAIFAAPLYTGCVDDERGFGKRRPGNIIRRSRFWLPLIALFSGLRMNEILQLTKWHVQTAPDGLPCLLIGDNMKVKTKASYRVVPLHRELIRCGLLEYVERLSAEDAVLFDDVPPGPDGYASSTFSKRFANFWKSLNANEPGRKVTFHSLRHNFRDALRQPGIDRNLAKEVGGWSRGDDVSDSYGDGARSVVLRPIIDAVEYNLDLRHLYLS